MSWIRKLFGLHDFIVSCEFLTNDDHFYGCTFPITVPKSLYNITDELVIEDVVKKVLFVKKGIVVKDIRITEFHEV